MVILFLQVKLWLLLSPLTSGISRQFKIRQCQASATIPFPKQNELKRVRCLCSVLIPFSSQYLGQKCSHFLAMSHMLSLSFLGWTPRAFLRHALGFSLLYCRPPPTPPPCISPSLHRHTNLHNTTHISNF